MGGVDSVGFVQSTSATLSLNHNASASLRTVVFVNYTRTDELEDVGRNSDPGRKDNFWRASATATYALTRHWSLALAYVYERRDSNRAENDFDENRVTLSLTGGFPLL